jgi:2',3'-cyclic-nucleotide 2'-phosphodiesterase (5'-nucleotidase family)
MCAPLAPAIADRATKLRSDGATVVIVTAHAGGRCTRFDAPDDLSSCDAGAEILRVARSLPPHLVDMIVAGHSHAGMAHEVAGIAITESFAGGRSFGRVDLSVDTATGRVTGQQIFPPHDVCARESPVTHACDPATTHTEARVPARYEGAPVRPDDAVAEALAPAIQLVRDLKASPLGVVLDTPLRRAGPIESPLGNLFADAFRESITGADVAVNNTDGGLRADLPAGPLTYGRLFEVFPFDNRLVSLRLTGGDLRTVVTGLLQRRRIIAGISGIRVTARCSANGLDVVMQRASGAPVRDEEPLVVVTTDFLATGGDGYFAPVAPPGGFSIPDAAPLARDVVADWLRRRGGHLRAAQLVDADHPRWTHSSALPMTCGRP